MDKYIKSYEELDIHRLMLSDKKRVLAYKIAIFNSKKEFQDKVVMDVGAGSGILSIFCAQVGAKKIYAVEASMLANNIKHVSIENNVEDRVEVINSKVEDIRPDSLEKIDIIVSEWMGFYLVHEGMLDSVLFARDNFLREGGLIFPSVAKLYVSPCQIPSMYAFWDDICGVSMRYIGQEYRHAKSFRPEVVLLKGEDLLAESKLVAWLDLKCITVEELELLGGENYVSVCEKDGRFQGMCIWFTVEFPDGTELSTAPHDEKTHWKQIVIVLSEDREVKRDEPVAYKFSLKRNSSCRRRYLMELNMLDAEEVEHDIPCDCHMTKCIVTKKYIDERESCAAENLT